MGRCRPNMVVDRHIYKGEKMVTSIRKAAQRERREHSDPAVMRTEVWRRKSGSSKDRIIGL